MTTPCTGPIYLSDIQTEFGGSNPINLSEYYSAASGVPASGIITLNDLRCKTKYVPAGTNGLIEYFSPGVYYFTVPQVTTEIRLIGIGGGGGGGGGAASGETNGSAGGSGGYLDTTMIVTAGTVITLTVATGGAGTGAWTGVGTRASTGSPTVITINGTTWYCYGGQGGASPHPGGVGGIGPTGNGAVGGESYWRAGGWGGNSYYTTAVQNIRTGGSGDNGSNSGSTAGIYGGGGGGGGGSNDNGWRSSGSRGGDGYIRIQY